MCSERGEEGGEGRGGSGEEGDFTRVGTDGEEGPIFRLVNSSLAPTTRVREVGGGGDERIRYRVPSRHGL